MQMFTHNNIQPNIKTKGNNFGISTKKIVLSVIIIFMMAQYVENSQALFGQPNNNGMLYELRRPVNYFYNRLQYKIDTNPLIAHLRQTDTVCSSKFGPYCSPINHRNIQQRKIKNWMKYTQMKTLHKVLKDSNPSNSNIAFQIERGQMNAFLIASDTYKKYDEFIREFVKTDMYKEPKPLDYQFKQDEINFRVQPQNVAPQQNQQHMQGQQNIQAQQQNIQAQQQQAQANKQKPPQYQIISRTKLGGTATNNAKNQKPNQPGQANRQKQPIKQPQTNEQKKLSLIRNQRATQKPTYTNKPNNLNLNSKRNPNPTVSQVSQSSTNKDKKQKQDAPK